MSGHICQMDRGQISWVTSASYELWILKFTYEKWWFSIENCEITRPEGILKLLCFSLLFTTCADGLPIWRLVSSGNCMVVCENKFVLLLAHLKQHFGQLPYHWIEAEIRSTSLRTTERSPGKSLQSSRWWSGSCSLLQFNVNWLWVDLVHGEFSIFFSKLVFGESQPKSCINRFKNRQLLLGSSRGFPDCAEDGLSSLARYPWDTRGTAEPLDSQQGGPAEYQATIDVPNSHWLVDKKEGFEETPEKQQVSMMIDGIPNRAIYFLPKGHYWYQLSY